MTRWQLGRRYEREYIHSQLGGDLQSYLPHVDGVVVCGCFDPDLNPDAPDVVLVGRAPEVERWAAVFAGQKSFVPVFLKRASKAWEFAGWFRVRSLWTDRADLAKWEAVSGRMDGLAMVLRLEERP